MIFSSDNWAGAAPQIVQAIAREAEKLGNAYGESALDKAVEARFSEVFEREVAVFLVGTGSAANALALASVNKPGGVVFCHRESHIIEDECGGVEYLTGGARLIGISGEGGKISAKSVAAAMARFAPGFVHSGQPMAVSITQQTEAGTVYDPAEVRDIAATARSRGVPLHMDGARFANAVAQLGISLAEATWKAGVDILSFGGTKNGCMGAEAIVFFEPRMAEQTPYLRKRAGQLFSKARFISAQFDRYLEDGLWLELAGHANSMADKLRSALRGDSHAREAWPTKGNEIFAVLATETASRLREGGAEFYDWHAPAEVPIGPDEVLVRLVTSFATSEDEVRRFSALLAESNTSLSGGRERRTSGTPDGARQELRVESGADRLA